MKRFILSIFVAAAILSGCNEVETEDNNTPICFGEASTRAEIKNASEIKEFKVYAEVNLGSDSATDGSDSATDGSDSAPDGSNLQWIPLLEGERVYRDNNGDGVTDDTGNFTYDNTRYWVNDRTFYFFGFYPETTVITRTAEESENGTILRYTGSVQVPYAADSDFMTALAIQEEIPEGEEFPESKPMKFKHHFANIGFEATKNANNARITITSIGFSGISRTANLSIVCQPGRSYEEELLPVAEQRTGLRRNLSYNIGNNTPLLEDNGLLVVPQSIADGQVMLNISYEYQQDGQDVEYYTFSKAIPAVEWKANQRYVYTLTLSVDKNIYISTPTVEEWGSPQSGAIIIIK